MAEIILTDQNFKLEIMKKDQLVLVDFWAPGCPPCMTMAPIIEEIAKEFKERAIIGKLDVSRNRETATLFGVMGVPTFIIFKDGQAIERFVGARPKRALVEKLNSLL